MGITLYRKYRPKTFDEVYGQDATVQTLRNQILSNKICHAYLFHGPRGSGKTSTARIFAKAINCSNTVNGNPCNQCDNCTANNSVNPDIIEIDGASNNGVEDVRKLIDEMNYKPTYLKYKVYIIDEVHMLTNNAFNALLKSIEEPPEHVVFIFATTELNKVPITIKSRCQVYNFKYIGQDDIVKALKDILSKENITNFNDEQCLKFIAGKSDGSLRDAISLLEQSITLYNMSNITLNNLKDIFGDVEDDIKQEFISCIENKNITRGIEILREQFYNCKDLKLLFNDLYQYYFDKIVDSFGTDKQVIYERYMNILAESVTRLEHSKQKIIEAELAFMRMCKPEMQTDYNSLVQRISELEKEISLLRSTSNIVQLQGNPKYIVEPEKVNKNYTFNTKLIEDSPIVYYNSCCNSDILVIGGLNNEQC